MDNDSFKLSLDFNKLDVITKQLYMGIYCTLKCWPFKFFLVKIGLVNQYKMPVNNKSTLWNLKVSLVDIKWYRRAWYSDIVVVHQPPSLVCCEWLLVWYWPPAFHMQLWGMKHCWGHIYEGTGYLTSWFLNVFSDFNHPSQNTWNHALGSS